MLRMVQSQRDKYEVFLSMTILLMDIVWAFCFHLAFCHRKSPGDEIVPICQQNEQSECAAYLGAAVIHV